MGNRGKLHDDLQRRVSSWRHARWVTCALEFNGRKRTIWGPDTYSELFFLDEATAFAAGHRPCAECRRSRYKEFKSAWLRANPDAGRLRDTSIDSIDAFLHGERLDSARKRTFPAKVSSLPDGTLVSYEGDAYLVIDHRLLKWSFAGYSSPIDVGADTSAAVLTPQSIVAMFSTGFVPDVHVSASRFRG